MQCFRLECNKEQDDDDAVEVKAAPADAGTDDVAAEGDTSEKAVDTLFGDSALTAASRKIVVEVVVDPLLMVGKHIIEYAFHRGSDKCMISKKYTYVCRCNVSC